MSSTRFAGIFRKWVSSAPVYNQVLQQFSSWDDVQNEVNKRSDTYFQLQSVATVDDGSANGAFYVLWRQTLEDCSVARDSDADLFANNFTSVSDPSDPFYCQDFEVRKMQGKTWWTASWTKNFGGLAKTLYQGLDWTDVENMYTAANNDRQHQNLIKHLSAYDAGGSTKYAAVTVTGWTAKGFGKITTDWDEMFALIQSNMTTSPITDYQVYYDSQGNRNYVAAFAGMWFSGLYVLAADFVPDLTWAELQAEMTTKTAAGFTLETIRAYTSQT